MNRLVAGCTLLALVSGFLLRAQESIVPPEQRMGEAETRVELGRLLATPAAPPQWSAVDTIVPPELRVSETDARLELGRLLATPRKPGPAGADVQATVAVTSPDNTAGETIVPPESRVTEAKARTELGHLLTERRGVAGAASPSSGESIVPPESRVSEEETRLALANLLAHPTEGEGPGTLVPTERRVSDYEARLILARLLAQAPRGLEQALRQYDRLVAKHGGYPERRERASLLLRLKQFDKAARELTALRKEHPRDVEIFADLADAEVGRGHFMQARDLYRAAIRLRPRSVDLSLRYARQMPAWGDFYEAERRFREALKRSPSRALELELASVLVGSQQYEAAEEIYRGILRRDRGVVAARLGVAEIRLREKDFAAALSEVDRVLAAEPRNAAALAMRAQASRGLGQVESGQELSAPLSGLPGSKERLTRLAEQSANRGAFAEAAEFYTRALARDPSYFPARLGLAETLAAQQQYDRSLEQLSALRADFPSNSKIILTQARVLSWARRYEESLATYQELRELNPHDVVPVREMARVAAWSKRMNLAQDLYRALYDRPLNARLRAQIAGMPGGPELLAAMQHGRAERPYSAYDQLAAAVTKSDLSAQARRTAATLLDQWQPSYRLQKTAWLEARGKLNAWHLDLLRAEDVLQELVAFQPGNQEALFDLAQAQAAQDLRGRAVETYQQILRVDPLHSLAARALERERIRASPAVLARYSLWDEKGSGRNADIQRHMWSLGGELVYGYQHWFRFSAGAWLDEPGGEFPSAFALGGIMEVENVWNEYLRTSASWTHKSYLSGDADDSDTGHFAATVNLFDWVHLSLGYVRAHENPNGFALRQGIHTDALELGIFATPHRYVELRGAVSKLWYTDGNEGVWAWFAPGFILSDHPHTLKLVFRGDYRDTAEESIYFFDGFELEDIRHPYWTPRNYLRGQAILEWRHDLSRDYYAGAELHYYALRAGIGTDNTRNDSYRLEAEWHYEFNDVWTIEALAMMERSREWDGNSVIVSLRRRFP